MKGNEIERDETYYTSSKPHNEEAISSLALYMCRYFDE